MQMEKGIWVGGEVVVGILVSGCEGNGKGGRKNMFFGGVYTVYSIGYVYYFKDVRQGRYSLMLSDLLRRL